MLHPPTTLDSNSLSLPHSPGPHFAGVYAPQLPFPSCCAYMMCVTCPRDRNGKNHQGPAPDTPPPLPPPPQPSQPAIFFQRGGAALMITNLDDESDGGGVHSTCPPTPMTISTRHLHEEQISPPPLRLVAGGWCWARFGRWRPWMGGWIFLDGTGREWGGSDCRQKHSSPEPPGDGDTAPQRHR